MPPWWAGPGPSPPSGGCSPLRCVGRAVAGGWGIFWNELLEGAAPGGARSVAAASTRLGSAVTSRTRVARWFDSTYGRVP